MNWDAIGAIGEIIGAVAVVGTLFYLAVQIRQNSVIAREQAHYHMLQNQISTIDRWATDRDYLETTFGKDLTEENINELQHTMVVQSILLKWNWEFLRAQEGLYDRKEIPVAGYRWLYSTASFGKHWSELQERLDPGFVKFMEEEVVAYDGSN